MGERFKEKYPDPDDYQAERYFCYRCGLAYETKFPECPRCGAEHPLPMHRYDWEMRQRASIAPNVNYCPECAHIYESNDYMCPFCKTLRINEMPYTITEHESESGEMYRVIRWDSIYYLDLLHWMDVNHPFIDPITTGYSRQPHPIRMVSIGTFITQLLRIGRRNKYVGPSCFIWTK